MELPGPASLVARRGHNRGLGWLRRVHPMGGHGAGAGAEVGGALRESLRYLTKMITEGKVHSIGCSSSSRTAGTWRVLHRARGPGGSTRSGVGRVPAARRAGPGHRRNFGVIDAITGDALNKHMAWFTEAASRSAEAKRGRTIRRWFDSTELGRLRSRRSRRHGPHPDHPVPYGGVDSMHPDSRPTAPWASCADSRCRSCGARRRSPPPGSAVDGDRRAPRGSGEILLPDLSGLLVHRHEPAVRPGDEHHPVVQRRRSRIPPSGSNPPICTSHTTGSSGSVRRTAYTQWPRFWGRPNVERGVATDIEETLLVDHDRGVGLVPVPEPNTRSYFVPPFRMSLMSILDQPAGVGEVHHRPGRPPSSMDTFSSPRSDSSWSS